MSKLTLVLALTVLATSATGVGFASAQGPIAEPLFEEFTDLNPCTGAEVIYTFTGAALIQDFGEHYLLVARGSVATSDGFSGSFNRQFVFQDGTVAVLRFHDMEAGDGTGQLIMFGVGLSVDITAKGEPVVSLLQFSGLRCVS